MPELRTTMPDDVVALSRQRLSLHDSILGSNKLEHQRPPTDRAALPPNRCDAGDRLSPAAVTQPAGSPPPQHLPPRQSTTYHHNATTTATNQLSNLTEVREGQTIFPHATNGGKRRRGPRQSPTPYINRERWAASTMDISKDQGLRSPTQTSGESCAIPRAYSAHTLTKLGTATKDATPADCTQQAALAKQLAGAHENPRTQVTLVFKQAKVCFCKFAALAFARTFSRFTFAATAIGVAVSPDCFIGAEPSGGVGSASSKHFRIFLSKNLAHTNLI